MTIATPTPPVTPTAPKQPIRQDSWPKLIVFGVVVCALAVGFFQAAVWLASLMAG